MAPATTMTRCDVPWLIIQSRGEQLATNIVFSLQQNNATIYYFEDNAPKYYSFKQFNNSNIEVNFKTVAILNNQQSQEAFHKDMEEKIRKPTE